VIANDVDMKRCGMLTHQTKRASSPTLLVLNHDAQHFPSLHGADDKDFRFDRVLADVPCTGEASLTLALTFALALALTLIGLSPNPGFSLPLIPHAGERCVCPQTRNRAPKKRPKESRSHGDGFLN